MDGRLRRAKGIAAGVDYQPGMEATNKQVESVQRRVECGEYVVDSQLVAAAMLERIGATISRQEIVSTVEDGRTLLRALNDLRAA